MKYRKKPVVIEAIQYTGSAATVLDFLKMAEASQVAFVPADDSTKRCLRIETLEGVMLCKHGDFLIRGVNGELYPCKPDIFAKTYEPVEETA